MNRSIVLEPVDAIDVTSVVDNCLDVLFGGPRGIRIPVSALRGPRPRPLDDGAASTSIPDAGRALLPFFASTERFALT